jgi:hypothetical protein
MSLNALEFAASATNAYELAAGIAMGVILPGLVFLTFRSGWPRCSRMYRFRDLGLRAGESRPFFFSNLFNAGI